MFPEHALNSRAVVSDLGRMAINLDEEDSARIAGQADMREVIHTDNGVVVQEFKGAGQDVLGNDTGHGLGRALNVLEDSHAGLGSFGRRHELHDGLGNDTEGALGLDEHAGKVVAGHALHRTGTALHQSARGVIELNAHDVVLGDTVLEAAQTSGVLGDVAADG